MTKSIPKIAIIHDFLIKLGGAEKVLEVMHEIYPEAPIYTILYDKEGTRGFFEKNGYKIIPSYLQKYPRFIRIRSKLLLSKFSKAVERMDLSEYDIVITSSNSYAHGAITKPTAKQVCYCYSPTRYLWDWYHQYLAENDIGFGFFGVWLRNLLGKLRIWDFNVSDRTDIWVAISQTVANRIKKYYRADSLVVYPPTDIEQFSLINKPKLDYYLIISRLSRYKKIDIAVEAFNKNGLELKIVGEGSEIDNLRSLAKKNIEFLGWKSESDKIKLLQNCKAFVFPGEEDFGLTPVEAMACGRPVIAYNKGGVTETVIESKTGLFFNDAKADSLNDAVNKFEKICDHIDPRECRDQAKKFSKDVFVTNFTKIIDGLLKY